MLTMERVDLVTKEVMKEFYKGNRVENRNIGEEMKAKFYPKIPHSDKMYEISMNDDLEEFFNSINLETFNETYDENSTFFLPKITDPELRCVSY